MDHPTRRTSSPFRIHPADGARALELLREADRLLDAAPRTLVRECVDARQGHPLMLPVAAVLGVFGALIAFAVVAATGRRAPGADTAGAVREYQDAVARVGEAGRILGEHECGADLREAAARARPLEVRAGAALLAEIVGIVHSRLRAELGAHEVPGLTNWSRDDAQDDAAYVTAGIGWRGFVWRLTPLVAGLAGVYFFFTLLRVLMA
jgi:hypothetical protein